MRPVIAAWCVLAVASQSQSPGLPAEVERQIAAKVEEERARLAIPGISCAVAVDWKLCWSRGFGFSDLENRVAATAQTKYRTASIAKSITATVLMQLAAAGQVDLDAPIQEFVPTFPEKPWPVTARQILSHTSGIRHYEDKDSAAETRHFDALEGALVLFQDDPLRFEPGSQFGYSTFAYLLLGIAAEHASGERFGAYLDRHVFGPAGMTGSCVDDVYLLAPNRTRGYQQLAAEDHAKLPADLRERLKPGDILNCTLHDTSMKVPGGGLLSTAEDLVRFGIAVGTAKIVDERSREAMWEEQTTTAGTKTGYGLGWNVGRLGDRKSVSHSGGQSGTSTLLLLVPERGVVVAAMCNLERTGLNGLVEQLATRVAQLSLE